MASPFQTVAGVGLCIGTTLTAQNYSAVTTIPWDTVVFDPEGMYDPCTDAGVVTIPAKYDGCSALFIVHVSMDDNSSGVAFLQLRHDDACTTPVNLGYGFTPPPSGSSQVRSVFQLSVPLISTGDTFYADYDSGSDTSISVNGTGGDFNPGCWMTLLILPPLGESG